MFSNKDLEKIMELSGVKNAPKLMESDHIDLEVAVDPDADADPMDVGLPDNVGEPLAPTYEDQPVDEYGIPMDQPMGDPEAGMMPGGGDNVMNQGMGGEMPAIGGMGGLGQDPAAGMPMDGGDCGCDGEVPPVGGEMPPMGDDPFAHFAAMPDDEFLGVISAGMPEMEEVVNDNQDGEQSPVGSEEPEMEMVEDEGVVEEEYDYRNGYEDSHVIDGEEYFPDGHDSNVRKKAGPLPNDADNNMNVRSLPVNDTGDLAESLYNKYKEDYAKFLKED